MSPKFVLLTLPFFVAPCDGLKHDFHMSESTPPDEKTPDPVDKGPVEPGEGSIPVAPQEGVMSYQGTGMFNLGGQGKIGGGNPPGSEDKTRALGAYLVFILFTAIDTSLEQWLHIVARDGPSSLASAAQYCKETEGYEGYSSVKVDRLLTKFKGKQMQKKIDAIMDNQEGKWKLPNMKNMKDVLQLFKIPSVATPETQEQENKGKSSHRDLKMSKKKRSEERAARKEKLLKDRQHKMSSFLMGSATIDRAFLYCVAEQFDMWVQTDYDTNSAKIWLDLVSNLGELFLLPWMVDAASAPPWADLEKKKQLRCVEVCRDLKEQQEAELGWIRGYATKLNEDLCDIPIAKSFEIGEDGAKQLQKAQSEVNSKESDNLMWYCDDALEMRGVGTNAMLVTDEMTEEINWVKQQMERTLALRDKWINTMGFYSTITSDNNLADVPNDIMAERDATCTKLIDKRPTLPYEKVLFNRFECCDWATESGMALEDCQKYEGFNSVIYLYTKEPSFKGFQDEVWKSMELKIEGNYAAFRNRADTENRYMMDYCRVVESEETP